MSIDTCADGKVEQLEIIQEEDAMKNRLQNFKDEKGKIGYVILWLLGVPFGLLLLIFLVRSCV
jgi:hypothetical protein